MSGEAIPGDTLATMPPDPGAKVLAFPPIAGRIGASRFNTAAMPQVTRAGQVAECMAHAHEDADFRDRVGEGDAARDVRDWARAEQGYAAGLARHPLHWGYCIQLAHVIKEQGQFERAEVWYRSAVAMGAPADMVDQHLAFVARQSGITWRRRADPRLDVPPLLAPPTRHDIGLLAELCAIPGMADDVAALELLRHAPDCRAVLRRFSAHGDFARSNRGFLELVGGLA